MLRYAAAGLVTTIGLVLIYFVGNLLVKALALVVLAFVVAIIVRGASRAR